MGVGEVMRVRTPDESLGVEEGSRGRTLPGIVLDGVGEEESPETPGRGETEVWEGKTEERTVTVTVITESGPKDIEEEGSTAGGVEDTHGSAEGIEEDGPTREVENRSKEDESIDKETGGVQDGRREFMEEDGLTESIVEDGSPGNWEGLIEVGPPGTVLELLPSYEASLRERSKCPWSTGTPGICEVSQPDIFSCHSWLETYHGKGP